MSEKNFYLCHITLQAPPFGALSNFVTYAIATNASEALDIAKDETADRLPLGWSIVGGQAVAIRRELLEQIAEEVLGWQRPD